MNKCLMTWANISLLIPLSLTLLMSISAMAATDPRASMVKIYVTRAVPDYQSPWKMQDNEQVSGSGCVVDDYLILTNAHVVGDQRFIQVRQFGHAEKYKARVVAVSHEVDLALLSVESPLLYETAPPLQLGDLPELQQDVFVYGFPEGGDTLSITRGVVSRVEHNEYVHSSGSFLAVQIDAAVNSGNSGGPVISDGKVVGVVMQILGGAQSTSYAVPVSIIKHFLTDLEDGKHDGIPQLCIKTQPLENISLREKYGMEPDQTGVLVHIPTQEDNKEHGLDLHSQDILLKIDNHVIANDGSVEFRPGERTSFGHYIDLHQVGDIIEFEILRNMKTRQVRIKMEPNICHQVPRDQYDQIPSYYIFGGLVFSPLTTNYLKLWGDEWEYDAPTDLLYFYENNYWKEDARELVNLIKVLPHDINIGYHGLSDMIVERVNETSVEDLAHLVELIETSNNALVELRLKGGGLIVIDRKQALESEYGLLKQYGIPKNKSL